MTERFATFRGGPFEDQTFPECMVPWPMFIPREPGDNGPPKRLTLQDVKSQPHYRLVGVNAESKMYEWVDEEDTLPLWFFANSPLSMDSIKGPDAQYRAGARDMLTLLRQNPEWLKEQTKGK